ncbi:MAG: chloramphenicol-sensitive protein RarD [Thermosediminibacterales bacterium]|nr:chloramphenicol-sensitive protein RarD [Thermosediminibacterales bacterium]
MRKTNTANNTTAVGILYAVMAFTVWGFLPIYWKLLNQIPAGQILAHRILWSFVFVFALLIFNGRLKGLKQVISNRKKLIGILFSAVIISINWGIYIWAVNSNHIIETSMGYYINPLITVFMGMVILKEKLYFWQIISLILASIGVLITTVQYGKIPWIALSLALTFALYGLGKKKINIDSMTGLALETFIIMPAALGYIILKQLNGTGILNMIPLSTTVMLLLSGIVTAMPLLWFAKGTKRIPLSMIGFIQYISPTINLFLGIFVFKEQFTNIHFLSFGFIWCGLILYSLSQTSILKNMKQKPHHQ